MANPEPNKNSEATSPKATLQAASGGGPIPDKFGDQFDHVIGVMITCVTKKDASGAAVIDRYRAKRFTNSKNGAVWGKPKEDFEDDIAECEFSLEMMKKGASPLQDDGDYAGDLETEPVGWSDAYPPALVIRLGRLTVDRGYTPWVTSLSARGLPASKATITLRKGAVPALTLDVDGATQTVDFPKSSQQEFGLLVFLGYQKGNAGKEKKAKLEHLKGPWKDTHIQHP